MFITKKYNFFSNHVLAEKLHAIRKSNANAKYKVPNLLFAIFFPSLVMKIRFSQWQSVGKEKVAYLRFDFLWSA